jgi:phosphatidylserine/phosphatidylglycerophosphate/cardiolipin synthase-like enzyme
MRERDRPRLEIVVVLNERAEALKEEVAVGLRQADNIEALRSIAAETGHALGCYYPLPDGATSEDDEHTYIHTKLMMVDDRFLTVGSANLTNRSMGVDSELNVSWEALATDLALQRRIRRVRVSLLAEHAGLSAPRDLRGLVRVGGLVARLDAIAARPGARLRRHRSASAMQQAVLTVVDPRSLPFDSDGRDVREADTGAPTPAARRWLA